VSEPAVACSLAPAQRGDRAALIGALTADALVDHEPIAGGVRWRFRASAGVEQRIRDLVHAESECCPFLRFDLKRDAALVLDITGPPDAQPVILKFFATASP
jgi:hypothetical protein